jgi:hypothetical protein
MNTKHTAGPWRAYESSDDGWFNIEAESDGSDVVGCEGCANEANARLIAAAPELLEALEEAETYLVERGIDIRGVTGRTVILPKMRAAIAKATGKEPA